MKYSENFSIKLNDLLNMNFEVEKFFLEAFNNATDNTLKTFFKERQIKRSEYSMEIRNEISKNNIAPKSVNVLNSYNYKNQRNTKSKDVLINEENLLVVVFRLINDSIERYNELLSEMNLPLSFCKILAKQRDDIQDTTRVFERVNIITA